MDVWLWVGLGWFVEGCLRVVRGLVRFSEFRLGLKLAEGCSLGSGKPEDCAGGRDAGLAGGLWGGGGTILKMDNVSFWLEADKDCPCRRGVDIQFGCSRDSAQVNHSGFLGTFDFLYLPIGTNCVRLALLWIGAKLSTP